MIIPERVARVPVSLGGLGVRLCSPSFAFAVATVGNRSQPSATVRNRLRDRRKALQCVWSGPENCSSALWGREAIEIAPSVVVRGVVWACLLTQAESWAWHQQL